MRVWWPKEGNTLRLLDCDWCFAQTPHDGRSFWLHCEDCKRCFSCGKERHEICRDCKRYMKLEEPIRTAWRERQQRWRAKMKAEVKK